MYMVDTHVHTCLSPCAELDMHPAALVDAAVRVGLDSVAVCDHNSAENVGAVQRAARAAGLAVIPGMEITSAEEVHILGLLPDLEAALALQSRIYRALPGHNDEEAFGVQVVTNEFAEVLGFNDHVLSGSTTLTVDEVVGAIHDLGGMAVASHVDREGFGIIGQLGFIPPGLPLDAIEISRHTTMPRARALYAPRGEYPILCASDAHRPEELGGAATFLLMEEATLEELRCAFAGKNGRTILGGGRPMEDLALHILDIAQNSIEAGADTIRIEISEAPGEDRLEIKVSDNGKGMDRETLARAADPFFTTRGTRKVGLGLSLMAAAAQATGGRLSITSSRGEGTTVIAEFKLGHIDRAPIGDLETTLMVLLAGHPGIHILFRHRIGKRPFDLDSADLISSGIDVSTPSGLAALRRMLRKGESDLIERRQAGGASGSH